MPLLKSWWSVLTAEKNTFRKTNRFLFIWNVLLELCSLHLCIVFFLKWWNYIKIFVLHELAVLLLIFFHILTSETSQKYYRSIVILWRLRIFGRWFTKTSKKKKHSFHNKHIYIMRVTDIEVLWSFILYTSSRFVLSLKNSRYAYIPPYIYKTLPTLRNEKEQ